MLKVIDHYLIIIKNEKNKFSSNRLYGRMGQQIIKSIKLDNNFKLVALTENRKINKKVNGIKIDTNTDVGI